MERLRSLVNILKLTPHRQPELVKEAANRILNRQIRSEPLISSLLAPLLEILIQYCDDNDSAQRSLFNDYLNSVISTFQYQHYQLILTVLIDEVAANGSARTITAALQRVPNLVRNIQPIDLGCDPSKLLKALIEVARRSEDESIQKAIDSTLQYVMPYLDYHIRTSKDVQFLANSLVEILLRNLQNESSQTKRLAASSIANICHNCETQLQNTLVKLKLQLDLLLSDSENILASRLVGFFLCVKEIPTLADQYHEDVIQVILKQILSNSEDSSLMNSALETFKDLLNKYNTNFRIAQESAKLIVDKFLLQDYQGTRVVKENTKVTLQSNALACMASLIKQYPKTLDSYEAVFLFKNHTDVAVRNQILIIIGNYIEASWRFPRCVEQSVDCEKIRKLWVELRSTLYDNDSHPDTLKSCIIAIRNCIATLIESDHCLHIVEYQDIDHIIHLYLRTSFKPFKMEVLNLFASLNYRTLHYLEKIHWSKMRSQTAGSYIDSLQDRIVSEIIIASLTDEHQRIRAAATTALVTIIPNLYITNMNNGSRNIPSRCSDPLVSLADDAAHEHLVVLKQADEHIHHFGTEGEPVISSESHATSCIKNGHKFLSSSIILSCDNPYNEKSQKTCLISVAGGKNRVHININLMYIIELLETSIEDSIDKGKTAISAIVRAFYELSLVYPVDQYSTSWDCRPSEYCKCFTLLNFLLTHLENLNEPDVIVEDLEAYRNFLSLSHQLLYALCHESMHNEYEHQRMKPYHKRQADFREGIWPDLSIKQPSLSDILNIFYIHLTKLLWLTSYIIEEKTNPFAITTKQSGSQETKTPSLECLMNHNTLTSNRLLFGRVYKKLESSFRSAKKNLNQKDEKFHQILETCLTSLASLLEFIGMRRSIENVRDIISYLKVTSTMCSVSSLVCARQLLKSLFGMNILALYQVDPEDWFEEEPWVSSTTNTMSESNTSTESVYHHLIDNPYKIFSNYYSSNCSKITPTSDRALAVMNYETRRSLKVRRRIEKRVKTLFEFDPNQIVSPRVRQTSEILKNTITEFTPIVTDCMAQFTREGFCHYQSETLHLMSYLILLRVNYQKLPMAKDFINAIHKMLDCCGEKMFASRSQGIEVLLKSSFTFLTLLTYERGPSKPMFLMPNVIQKLDDVRAKLSMSSSSEQDISVYIVPLLRCLVEDLFIYRTKQFQSVSPTNENAPLNISAAGDNLEMIEQNKKDIYEILEAERETVAQKLLDVMENPEVYDLVSILILESRQNSSEIKYKKLSKHLLSVIPRLLSERGVNLTDYRRIELTRKIIENISPELFQPVNFILETLLEAPKPSMGKSTHDSGEFKRWMSLVIIAIHILNTQVKEEVFLTRLRETMSAEDFVEYLLHIVQLCAAEILMQLSQSKPYDDSGVQFIIQQLSCYILYLTHMFQSGLFSQLTRNAEELIKREIIRDTKGPRKFSELFNWARDPNTGFSLNACEEMFLHMRLVYPDLTILWCNVMMLLYNVDCNRDFWRNLLIYECHQCQVYNSDESLGSLEATPSTDNATIDLESIDQKEETNFKRGTHINRPSSLNLSDISFSDQLRRSFIKRIAASETARDRAFNRNIIETSDEDGQLLETEVTIGNTEQCLAPNIELSRRGALCLVLDYVTTSMNDVEHITWLIIHHVNDIVRWSHELPITEFISAVHRNSASSGIFIQAINNGFNNLTSISHVTRLIWTLEKVHYTQYGSLVVLLVEKLLSAEQLLPYRSLTRSIEEFACATVQKLLDDTHKNLVTTNDEVVNQLAVEDLDRVISMLDTELYPHLTKLLAKLRESNVGQSDNPLIELSTLNMDSDEDSDGDEVESIYAKANLIYWLAEQNSTASVSNLIPALIAVKDYLGNPKIVENLSKNDVLVSFLVSAIYSFALTVLPPPARQIRPMFWQEHKEDSNQGDQKTNDFSFDSAPKPSSISLGSRRPVLKQTRHSRPQLTKKASERTDADIIEDVRSACIKCLFLLENLDLLGLKFEFFNELIIRLSRLPLINAFVLTPQTLWRQNIWPTKFQAERDEKYKVNLPMVPHDILTKDNHILGNFCDRLLKLGWISRRQFEEAWMVLLGVLSSSLSQSDNGPTSENNPGFGRDQDLEKRANLVASCKVVTTITKLLLMTRKVNIGDPSSQDIYPVQEFDDRVVELTKAIGTNLSALRTKTQPIFESVEIDRSFQAAKSIGEAPPSPKSIANKTIQQSGFTYYLRIPAQKLRMNSILNLEISMIDAVVIGSEHGDSVNTKEVDVESCIRLLLSIYKQKIKDPGENLLTNSPMKEVPESGGANQHLQQLSTTLSLAVGKSPSKFPNQLAPPLTTAICQSILALSDMFTEYEQFDWMFETFVQMFRAAERNEDEVQMSFLIMGLCKAAAVCCYEIPTELTTIAAINHRDVMFEKCRQSIEKCVKSNFGPLRVNALFAAYYMLEDSINIVASGAWELDHFRRLRQSRLAWILKLAPIVLDKDNFKLLTKRQQIMKLLDSLCEIVSETELKTIKI